jgi:hypothetical protein
MTSKRELSRSFLRVTMLIVSTIAVSISIMAVPVAIPITVPIVLSTVTIPSNKVPQRQPGLSEIPSAVASIT